ncbi:MAG: sulfurtransferase [Campylobacterales bacterium]
MRRLLVAASMTALLASSAVAGEEKPMFISAKEAKELLGKPGVVFVSGDTKDVFNVNHIPGSVVMDAHHIHHTDITGQLHCSPLYQCPEEAEKFIGEQGIDNDTYVIAYDDYKGPNASGVYHFFKSIGHDKVSILNGGMMAMKAEGVTLEKGPQKKVQPKTYRIDRSKIRFDIMATKEEVKKAVDDLEAKGDASRYVIIDTRRFEEIIGVTKLDNVARGGHIPYAKFIEWKHFSDANKKLTVKDAATIKAILEKNGITKDKEIYTYCHVGTGRGSYLFTILKMLGYDKVKVYTGSWDEWGNDFNMPIKR